MSHSWVRQCLELLEQDPCVLVTLRRHKGSAPRESGARMVVNETGIRGSIGGGNLEYQAIATAREMLADKAGRDGGAAPTKKPSQPDRGEGAAPSEEPSQPDRGEGAAPTRSRQVSQDLVGAAPSPRSAPRLEPYGLGPALNQCCGGSVELLFEYIRPPAPDWLAALSVAVEGGDRTVLATAIDKAQPRHVVAHAVGRESSVPEDLRTSVRSLLAKGQSGLIEVAAAEGCDWWLERISGDRRPVLLFGAGHVGKAVVRILADLPFDLRWIDSRDHEFPERLPENVTAVPMDDPTTEVSRAEPDTIFIVMTHSHDLDEAICHAVLERGDFAFLGLIGSVSKHRRFVHRLGKRGISQAALDRLVCPIGLPGISGKEPATIALSLAAQLMTQPDKG